MEAYEAKLDKQIRAYQKYLGECIWSVLPEIERSILNLKEPVLFNRTNKSGLLNSLGHSNWPVSKQDIAEFEDQIELAKTYLKLSRSLREVLSPTKSVRKEKYKENEATGARTPTSQLDSPKATPKSRVGLWFFFRKFY